MPHRWIDPNPDDNLNQTLYFINLVSSRNPKSFQHGRLSSVNNLPVVIFFLFSVSVLLQIATQIAVLIAKVARLDCPKQWPELIPILLESVKGQDGLQQHRALLTFYHVTKTLASKRLAQDRRLFQDVSPHCCAFVGKSFFWEIF